MVVLLAEVAAFNLVQVAAILSKGGAGGDFRAYFAAARVGVKEGWRHIYNTDLQFRYEQAAWPGSSAMVYITPPPVAWMLAPFTILPPSVAYVTFAGLMALALLAAAVLAGPGRGWWRATNAVWVVAFGPAILCVLEGQVVGLVALSVAAAQGGPERPRRDRAGGPANEATDGHPGAARAAHGRSLAAGAGLDGRGSGGGDAKRRRARPDGHPSVSA